MHRKDRPGSRWNSTPRNTPCHPDTHPVEREQALRHKRRHRLPGEPSETHAGTGNIRPTHTLIRLKGLHRTLLRDRDSRQAWMDLAGLFATLDDRRRARLCEDIARKLHRLPPAA